MYLDGYSPEQILHAAHKKMMRQVEEREAAQRAEAEANEIPNVKIISEVKIRRWARVKKIEKRRKRRSNPSLRLRLCESCKRAWRQPSTWRWMTFWRTSNNRTAAVVSKSQNPDRAILETAAAVFLFLSVKSVTIRKSSENLTKSSVFWFFIKNML